MTFGVWLLLSPKKTFAFFLVLSTMLLTGWRQPVVSEKHLGNKSTYGGVLDISLLAGRIRVTALLQFFSSTADVF